SGGIFFACFSVFLQGNGTARTPKASCGFCVKGSRPSILLRSTTCQAPGRSGGLIDSVLENSGCPDQGPAAVPELAARWRFVFFVRSRSLRPGRFWLCRRYRWLTPACLATLPAPLSTPFR